MKHYTMQDRSGGQVNRTDEKLSLLRVLEMTDYNEEEIDKIADLKVGEELLIGSAADISVLRTK